MAKKPTKQTKVKALPTTAPEVRVGVLTAEEFKATLSDALGGRGWQKTFVRGTGLSPSTVTRYLQGTFPIPQYIGLIVEMLQTLRRNRLPMPDAFSDTSEGSG